MIKFRCDVCQKKIGVPDHGAGKRVVCPGCGQTLRVPGPSGVASVSASPPAPPPAAPERESAGFDLGDLMPDSAEPVQFQQMPEAEAAPRVGLPKTCPTCQSTINPAAVLCIHCGQALGEGKGRLATEVRTADRQAASNRRELMRSSAGLAAGALVAGVFSVIWVVLVLVTHYQFGVLAWGIGALIGLTAGRIARNPTPVFGGMVALLAFGSLMGAKLILAALILFASFGLDLMDRLALQTDEDQRVHYAVMDQMLEEGALTGDPQRLAQYQVTHYFDPLQNVENPIAGLSQLLNAVDKLESQVGDRIDAMSRADRQTALVRARERWPQWIEDEDLYLAVVSDQLDRQTLPADLALHARQKLSAIEGAYDVEYFQVTSLRDQETRERGLRERATAQIADLSDAQRQAVIDAARLRHPRWIVDETLHYAVLWKMLGESALTGSVRSVAQADVSMNMTDRWEQPFLDQHDEEQIDAWRDQATAMVNHRIATLNVEERLAVIAAAEAAHPDWQGDDGAEARQLRQALTDEGFNGSFGSALRVTFRFWDLLWFGLALSTAYSVAVKQAD